MTFRCGLKFPADRVPYIQGSTIPRSTIASCDCIPPPEFQQNSDKSQAASATLFSTWIQSQPGWNTV